ncbi:conserved hypothetical protein [Arthrobacter sp. 9AX]|uniref:hypothetical protein n=1 Tax=Arthrobacter sp. 9AX TaxID=2653131 RepID=UPI0012F2E1E9|nr:hypothetical protein [Arthrobacter sp. 9AX]VXC16091.1 conserved hypothetical protein [Arthrobacter sp. 9AX]
MMTENQWTNVAGSSSQDTEATTAIPTTPVATPAPGAGTKKDAAKEEASNVAGKAAEAAQGVAQTAKDEVANVAAEAKSSAKDLLSQAKSGLSSQAGTQQQKAAEGIRTISSQLQSMAQAPDQQGIASDLARQAAERASSVASWVEGKDPAALLTDVQSFARRKPGTFLLLAAGAGILVGRLARGLQAGAPVSQGAAATSPVGRAGQAAGTAPGRQGTVVAAGGADLYDEPVVSGAPVSVTTLPSGTAEDTPLRFEDDLEQSKEGRHL